jgi:azurin
MICMKLCSAILYALLAISVPALADQATASKPATQKPTAEKATVAKGEPRTIELTASENMKYDKTTLTARAGEKIRIVLKALGTMPKVAMGHNFVLLKANVSPLEVNNAAFNARATDFIPESQKDKILAFTPVAGGGETVETTFTAPKAGTYTFLCTFPGHFVAGMKGTLVVK